MTETKKTFTLKMLALLKREIDEKLIGDRMRDQDIREAISLWPDSAGKVEPIIFVEIVYKANKETLLAVSFEKVDEEFAEFECIEDIDFKKSKQTPKVFNADIVKSCMPNQPLAFRSLLSSADIELSVSDKPIGQLTTLKKLFYKHKSDSAIDIFVYSRPSIEEMLKDLAIKKLDHDLNKVTDIVAEDESIKGMLDSVLCDSPQKQPLRRNDFEKPLNSKLSQLSLAIEKRSFNKVSGSYLKLTFSIEALADLDRQAMEDSDDLIAMAAQEARQLWEAGNTLCFESFVIADADISQNTWHIGSKRHRDQPIDI